MSLPLLQKGDNPSISVKEPIQNLLLSNSMRFAVVGMMRTIAGEFGPDGIRVNAICPGYIHTKRVDELLFHAKTDDVSPNEEIESRIPLGRMGNPSEFGAVCTILLSPIASYIHGALLLVDGGLYRGMM